MRSNVVNERGEGLLVEKKKKLAIFLGRVFSFILWFNFIKLLEKFWGKLVWGKSENLFLRNNESVLWRRKLVYIKTKSVGDYSFNAITVDGQGRELAGEDDCIARIRSRVRRDNKSKKGVRWVTPSLLRVRRLNLRLRRFRRGRAIIRLQVWIYLFCDDA